MAEVFHGFYSKKQAERRGISRWIGKDGDPVDLTTVSWKRDPGLIYDDVEYRGIVTPVSGEDRGWTWPMARRENG